MSQHLDDRWIKEAYSFFTEAVERKDISLAKCIIADSQEYGFLKEAQQMNEELREATNNN